MHAVLYSMHDNAALPNTHRFAFQRAQPPIDASQDLTASSASRTDGATTVRFNRPRNSGDSNDISLDVCRFFLFAFGGTVFNFDTQDVGYHGLNRRFISPERICIPTFAECSGKLACVEVKVINQIHLFAILFLAPPSISLDCNGATDADNNIVFDCTSDVDLTTANLQCFLNGTQQATCKSRCKLE